MPGVCPGEGMLKLRFDWYIIKAGVRSLYTLCKSDQSVLLSRIVGCKWQIPTKSQTGFQCLEAEFLAHSQKQKVMNMSQMLLHLLFYLFLAPLAPYNDGSIKLLSLQIELVEKQYFCLRALIFSSNFSEELSREHNMNLSQFRSSSLGIISGLGIIRGRRSSAALYKTVLTQQPNAL